MKIYIGHISVTEGGGSGVASGSIVVGSGPTNVSGGATRETKVRTGEERSTIGLPGRFSHSI